MYDIRVGRFREGWSCKSFFAPIMCSSLLQKPFPVLPPPPTQQLAPNQSSHCATSIRSQQRILLFSSSSHGIFAIARCPDTGSVQLYSIGPLCLTTLITHFYSGLWRRLQDRYRDCVSTPGNGTVLWGTTQPAPGTLGGVLVQHTNSAAMPCARIKSDSYSSV